MKRVFISLNLPQRVLDALEGHIGSLKSISGDRRVSWVKRENLHITLRFLGEIEDDAVSEIKESFRGSGFGLEPADLSIGSPGSFGGGQRPVVLWAGFEDAGGSLPILKELLDERLAGLGYEKEDRQFTPHATIARIRRPSGTADIVRAHRNAKIEPAGFSINSFSLMESKLKPEGPVYTELLRIAL